MNRFCNRLLTCAIITCVGLAATIVPAFGVELTFPGTETEPGQSFEIPVLIDAVENLAGVKLSLSYDPKVLTFQKADKTKATTSLMHIVNDKKPGVLIIVMAGARGIKGKNFPLLLLHFEAKVPEKIPHKTEITVKEIQLMSDQLKDLPAQVVTRPILIGSPKKAEKAPDSHPESNATSPSDAQPPSDATSTGGAPSP